MTNIYCHVFLDSREAVFYADEYIRQHEDEVERVMRTLPRIVTLKNGEKHYFMSEATYRRWRKGRTYYIGDILFRSGYPFKEVEE